MRRLIFNLAAGVSLGVCLFLSGMWIRSFFTQDMVFRTRVDQASDGYAMYGFRFGCGRGTFLYGSIYGALSQNPQWHSGWFHTEPAANNMTHGILDIKLLQYSVDPQPPWKANLPTGITIFVGVRLWPLISLTAVLPGLWGWLFVRRRGKKPGFCPQCGYDLRATPNRCPECGLALDGSVPRTT